MSIIVGEKKINKYYKVLDQTTEMVSLLWLFPLRLCSLICCFSIKCEMSNQVGEKASVRQRLSVPSPGLRISPQDQL